MVLYLRNVYANPHPLRFQGIGRLVNCHGNDNLSK